MKRILFALLTLTFLCSCHNDGTNHANETDLGGQIENDIVSTVPEETNSPHTPSAEADRGEGGVVFRTQYPVYDKSCTYVSTVIENHGEETLEFGAEWHLERLEKGEWRKVAFMDEMTWIQPLYMVMPDGYYIDHCSLSIFKKPLTEGEYRVVKKISGKVHTAAFTIGASPVTAASPHGFTPLDRLPADYSPEDAVADGVVVCGRNGVENADKIEAFFRNANAHNWRGQLRIARFTTEGGMILTDVIRSRPDRIDCIIDTTRDAFGTGEIITEYYSYFVYAEDNVYLANHTEPNPQSDRCLFEPKCVADAVAEIVAGYYAHEDSAAMSSFVVAPPAHSAWTPDGEVRASSNGGAELAFSTTGWGTVWHIKMQQEGMTVTDLIWENNDICMIEATFPDGTYYYEFIRVGREGIMDIESLSHITSAHRYTESDQGLVIPE